MVFLVRRPRCVTVYTGFARGAVENPCLFGWLDRPASGSGLILALINYSCRRDLEPRLDSGADCPVGRFAGCQRSQPAGRSQRAELEFYSTLRRLAVGDTAGWQPALRLGSWKASFRIGACIGTMNRSSSCSSSSSKTSHRIEDEDENDDERSVHGKLTPILSCIGTMNR